MESIRENSLHKTFFVGIRQGTKCLDVRLLLNHTALDAIFPRPFFGLQKLVARARDYQALAIKKMEELNRDIQTITDRDFRCRLRKHLKVFALIRAD